MKRPCLTVMACLSLLPSFALSPSSVSAQTADLLRVAYGYQVVPNITYHIANGWNATLDVYQPRSVAGLTPTLIYIHGGGWTGGNKESSALVFLPYLEMGWTVVNVEYRVAKVSQAPAAVEDCLCALRWVYRNAKEYNFDLNRLVVTGQSAGGHLALMTGMVPASVGLDRQCPGNEELKVAAVINWYGITDVADLLEGANMRTYAVTWLGAMVDRIDVARRVSPLTYVRPGLPPILSIQGDADPVVPYLHSVRLQRALSEVGAPNQLVTVPGGRHGSFSIDEYARIYVEIRRFLSSHGLGNASNHRP